MITLLIIILVVIVFLIISNSKPKKNNLKPGQIELEVSMPNPATCSYQSFKDFVDRSTTVELNAVLKELDKRGVYLKTSFRQLVENKIKQFYYVEETIEPINEFVSANEYFDNDIIETKEEPFVFKSEQKIADPNKKIIEIKGVHLKYRKSNILENCFEGDLVDLIPEPTNEFDKNAVMVKKHGKLLGYLDSKKTKFYHKNKHLFKEAKIFCIDYDDENDYLYTNVELSFFTEDQIDSHDEYDELKTNKISRKYLFPKKNVEDPSNYFYRKKVVITGTFVNFPYRNEIAMMLWEVGADVDTAVSERTDILIIGDNAGWSKQEKVLEMQTECIDEDIFIRYFNNYKPKFN